MTISFQMNSDKAIETLVWLACRVPGFTPFYVSKILFFADKAHLNRYGRPILGDSYVKMEYGPVPSRIYDWLKGQFLSDETKAKFDAALAIRSDGFAKLYALREPDVRLLSRTDLECLDAAVKKYGRRDFGLLSRLTHKERAWLEAPENGPIDYELLVDENNPRREDLIEHLRETGPHLVF